MTDTTHLALPLIAAAQAQKHVTHNEALRSLDALVMLSVDDRDLSAPPGSPTEGARYLVKATGTGASPRAWRRMAQCIASSPRMLAAALARSRLPNRGTAPR